MRILCLTSRLPYPPYRGDRLRAYHFIKQFASEHEVTLISFIADKSEKENVDALLQFCREVHIIPKHFGSSAATAAINLWRRIPLQVLYYRSAEMRRLVDHVINLNDFDLVYIHLFRMAPYIQNNSDIYRVMDLTDVISSEIEKSLPFRPFHQRLLYRWEYSRIERFERQLADSFEETWLVSESDRLLLSAKCPAANIRTVPNGVDFESLHPESGPEVPNSLVFVGHMGVFHNIDAAKYLVNEILPLVRKSLPEVRLNIVGAEPGQAVLGLGSVEGVTVSGFVPNLNEALNKASIFVAPLRFAAGLQNKVLEAMAAGRPVVTTSIVNEGLGARPNRDLIVADEADDIAQKIISLLQDSKQRKELGESGFSFVRQRFSWQTVADRVNAIEKIIKNSTSG